MATKLDAVNTIISNIGQAPVAALDTGNPLAATAQLVLEEVTKTVQAEGWAFNRENEYPIHLDTNDELVIPTDVMQIDLPALSDGSLVRRSGKLYDKTNHSYDLSDYADFNGIVKCDIIWEFDFEDIPAAVQHYITIRAANVFAGRSVGSTEAVRFGQQEETLARAAAIEYETQQGDFNMFGDVRGLNVYNSYRPRHSLYRY